MISQRSRYALKALIRLVRADKGASLSTRVIAAAEEIPVSFLEQIMLDLKRAGFVGSRRGKEGGYFIAKDPSGISLATVLRQIDGPVAPLQCLSRTAYKRCDDCKVERTCALRIVLRDTHEAVLAVLEKRTLAEAVARADLESSEEGNFGPDVFAGAYI